MEACRSSPYCRRSVGSNSGTQFLIRATGPLPDPATRATRNTVATAVSKLPHVSCRAANWLLRREPRRSQDALPAVPDRATEEIQIGPATRSRLTRRRCASVPYQLGHCPGEQSQSCSSDKAVAGRSPGVILPDALVVHKAVPPKPVARQVVWAKPCRRATKTATSQRVWPKVAFSQFHFSFAFVRSFALPIDQSSATTHYRFHVLRTSGSCVCLSTQRSARI